MLQLEVAPKLLRFTSPPSFTRADQVIPNTVVQGRVLKIVRDGSHVTEIHICVEKILSVAHSGRELYLPHKRDQVFYEGDAIMCSRLRWPSDQLRNVFGRVEGRHTKDREMQYLDDGVLMEGDTVNALVRDVVDENELSLSLLNSRLQGCKQSDLHANPCFHLLGLQSPQQLTLPSEQLLNQFNNAGLNPYANFNQRRQQDQVSLDKLREVQNMLWSQNALDRAQELTIERRHEEALECCQLSVEFDPLNREALLLKGKIFLQTTRNQEAEQALREAFKIDPSDAEVEKLLEETMMVNRSI